MTGTGPTSLPATADGYRSPMDVLRDALTLEGRRFAAWSATAEGAYAMVTHADLHAGPYRARMWFSSTPEGGLRWVHTGPCEGTPQMALLPRQVTLADAAAQARDLTPPAAGSSQWRRLMWCRQCLAEATAKGGESARQVLLAWTRTASAVGRLVHAQEVLFDLEGAAARWLLHSSGDRPDAEELMVGARRLLALAKILDVGHHMVNTTVSPVPAGLVLAHDFLQDMRVDGTATAEAEQQMLHNLAWVEAGLPAAQERCRALLAAFPTRTLAGMVPYQSTTPWWDCAQAVSAGGGGPDGNVLTLFIDGLAGAPGSLPQQVLSDVVLATGELLADHDGVRLYRLPAVAAAAALAGTGAMVVPAPAVLPVDAPAVLVAAAAAAAGEVSDAAPRWVPFAALLEAAVTATT